jgi:hypothetical protein
MDDERRSRLDAKRSRHATTIGNDSHDETKARLDAKNASLDLRATRASWAINLPWPPKF